MSFEEMDYIEIDYDTGFFTILKNGEFYKYDINREINLLDKILESGNVEFEIYGQEREL